MIKLKTVSGKLAGLVLTAMLGLALQPAGAADVAAFPNKPIRLIVPTPPGGITDGAARIISQALSSELKQPVVIDNKPGGSGMVAMRALMSAPADGYTLMMGLSGFMLTLPLKHGPGVDVYAAGTPVAYLSDTFFVLVTGTSQPFDDLKGLVSFAKANPGKVSYASSGVGSSNHIIGERLKQVSEMDMSHIPYQGDSAMLADVINGRVTVGLGGAAALEMVRAGKLKAIGIVAPVRSKLAANVPTLKEQGADVSLMPWNVLVAPKGLDAALVDKINRAVSEATSGKDVQDRLAGIQASTRAMTPTQLNAFIAQEMLTGREVIRRANIQLD
jgi:tripartite-type tricarboxylate transporter receptor subunit TctC